MITRQSTTRTILLTLLFPLLTRAEITTQDCSCYSTNSSAPFTNQLYNHYQFFDFRKFGRVASADYIDQSPWVEPSQDQGSEKVTDPYFSSPSFASTWDIQSWTTKPKESDPAASTEKVVNSARNIYISRDDQGTNISHVTFRTISYSTFQSTAEMQTKTPYLYASIRARARVTGPPGGCAGIFLYHDDSNESDIEILTADPVSKFRLTNNPDVDPDTGYQIPNASTIDTFPPPPGSSSASGNWSEWNEYRLDWFPTRSDWYVNGKLIESKTYGVMKTECNFMVNMWSNGGTWSGNMTEDQAGYLDVQWLEMVYNTTVDAGKACDASKRCEVDRGSEKSGSVKLLLGKWVWVVLGWTMLYGVL